MEFVSCIKWVNQGLAKSQPDKVTLNEQDLKQLIDAADSDAEQEDGESNNKSEDEFKFDNYDKEDDTLRAKLKDVASYNDFGKINKNDNSSDSDEDEMIKPDDNLILAGIVGEDETSLLIYVYNDNDGDMYVHHDLMLSSAPLCIDYLHHKDNDEHSNLCIIGSMDPVIEIWDLDIIGCVEPAFKLGKYKKGSKKNYGHTEAVLDVASNTNFSHVLASASVDKTVLLWDLSTAEVATTMTQFKGDIQSIEWNLHEQYLLTGSKDKMLKNFDCRVNNVHQKWKLESPIEKVTWSTTNSFTCFAGTEQGYIYTIDIRNNKPLRQFQAHTKEVTGLRSSNVFSELLLTCGADEIVNIWDISKDVNLLTAKSLNIGALQCLDVNADRSFTGRHKYLLILPMIC